MHQSLVQLRRIFLFGAVLLAVSIVPVGAQTPTPTPTPTPGATATPSPAPTPVIQLISPKVTFPGKGDKRYVLTLVGTNLGKPSNAGTMFVYLDDNIVRPEWIDDEAKAVDPQKTYGLVQQPDTQLQLFLPWPKYSGAVKIKMAVDGKVSGAADIVVSKIESKWKAAWWAAAITLALLGLPLLLVSHNADNVYQVGDKKFGVLAAFFLDKETDTYSLSKFQFYAWTAVAIFGYVYLGLVESLVQGKAVFPEIPENLPALILVSAGTSVLATGITNARGPKGSGETHPSLGDFVTAGGLVVAERFQFFVWTLLGTVTFLFFTLSSDPATLHDLPKIPDSFLQIMGISSLGYLSGKLARKPGPVIDQIQPEPAGATAVTTTLKLTITGQKFSQTALLRIHDDDVKLADTPLPNGPSAKLAASTKEEQGEFCKKLVFQITNPDPKWKAVGKHKVTITNDDGKAASWDYELT